MPASETAAFYSRVSRLAHLDWRASVPFAPSTAALSMLHSCQLHTPTRQNSNYKRPPDRFVSPGRFGHIQGPEQAGARSRIALGQPLQRRSARTHPFSRTRAHKKHDCPESMNFAPGHSPSLLRRAAPNPRRARGRHSQPDRTRRPDSPCGTRYHQLLRFQTSTQPPTSAAGRG
jgi:hypothetical protein